MRISISSQNEYAFTPDVFGNLELPDDEQFQIICRRVDNTLYADRWSSFNFSGELVINPREKIRSHIVKFVNAPMLSVDGKTEKELTIDELLSGKYIELSDLVAQLTMFISKSYSGDIEFKKK